MKLVFAIMHNLYNFFKKEKEKKKWLLLSVLYNYLVSISYDGMVDDTSMS